MVMVVPPVAFAWLVWAHPPVASWSEMGAMRWAGAAMAIVGFVMLTAARWQLGSSFSVTAQARQLVTGGVYRRVRNPIYVFSTLALSGLALLYAHPVWLLGLVVLIPLQLWRAEKESRVLEAKFGEEYRVYRRGTWF